MLAALQDEPDLVHRSWVKGLTLDDYLWFQSIVTCRSQGLRLQGGLPHDDKFLWDLLRMGYCNGKPEDRPWDALTRAMRYGAILGDRIQANVERERHRVSTEVPRALDEYLSWMLLRVIVLRPR